MTRPWRTLFKALLVATAAALASDALAHSASDAYLSLDTETRTDSSAARKTVIHGQWDIALRDLDFVIKLDDDGDGNIDWRELRGHQTAIARYALERLSFLGDGKPCKVSLTRQLVDNHADGAYAALFFDIACADSPQRLTLDYRLFFAIDPSHRAILISRSGNETATAVLSPQNAKVDLKLFPGKGGDIKRPANMR